DRGRTLLWRLKEVAERPPPPETAVPAEGEGARLRALLDAASDVLWEAELDTGRLLFIGAGCEGLTGFPAEDWHGDAEFGDARVHPDARPMVASLRERQRGDLADLEMEYRLATADGRTVWVRERSRVDPRAPHLVRGSLVNINRRKRFERKL